MGGTLLCGDPVRSILGSAKGVEGVGLASGRILHSARIVAAIHPKTLLPMLPEGAVTPRYARRIAGLEDTDGLFVANVAVDAKAHTALPHNIYRLYTDRDGTLRDGVFYQLLSGRADRNLLMIIAKSPFSEWQPWEGSTTGSRGAAYSDEKTRRAYRLVREAGEIFGHIAGAEVLDAYTPLTLRDWVNSPQGSPYGIMRSAKQLHATTFLHHLNLRGLFFAGQNALSPGALGTLL